MYVRCYKYTHNTYRKMNMEKEIKLTRNICMQIELICFIIILSFIFDIYT